METSDYEEITQGSLWGVEQQQARVYQVPARSPEWPFALRRVQQEIREMRGKKVEPLASRKTLAPRSTKPMPAQAKAYGPVTNQVGVEDPRKAAAIKREIAFLSAVRETALADYRYVLSELNRMHEHPKLGNVLSNLVGDPEFWKWLHAVEARIAWLRDQWKRKRAAERNGLVA